MSLRTNIIANYFGQAWRVLILLAFVPAYIKYLGIESYGLIGLFAVLQAWLGLLDFGFKASLARESARYAAGAHDEGSFLELLRSMEIVTFVVAILVSLAVWCSSQWAARNWLNAGGLDPGVVAEALALMGLIISSRFYESIYGACLGGLQRQVLLNVLSVSASTLQGLGAIALLAWVSPKIEVFFAWQLGVSLATVAVLRVVVHRILPRPKSRLGYSSRALLQIWRFAAGMVGITLSAVLLTQVDKILLSHWLSLEAFGYYSVATLVASGLDLFTGPVATAAYPHIIELVTRNSRRQLIEVYHQSAQLITVMTASVAAVLVMEPERVLMIWTGDRMLSSQTAPIMSLLVLGTLAHCMMWIPYQLQLAHGWTRLTLMANATAIVILLPCLWYVVPKYGALGAASIWIVLNMGYLLVTIQLMHRRLLAGEKWRWYGQDVVLPTAVAFLATATYGAFVSEQAGRVVDAIAIAGSMLVASLCAVAAAPILRRQVVNYLVGRSERWK